MKENQVFKNFGDVRLPIPGYAVSQAQVLEIVFFADLEHLLASYFRSRRAKDKKCRAQKRQVIQRDIRGYRDLLGFQEVADFLSRDQGTDIVRAIFRQSFQERNITYPKAPHDVFVEDRVIDVLKIIVNDPVLELQIDKIGKAAELHVLKKRIIIIDQFVENKEFRIGKAIDFDLHMPARKIRCQFAGE